MQIGVLGFDAGNHWSKGVIKFGDWEAEQLPPIPSMLATDKREALKRGEVDTFSIISGSGQHNKLFETWSTNPIYRPKQVVVSEENHGRGKPNYALPLLISLIWNHIGDNACIKVAISVHDKQAYGDAMKEAVAGTHTVEHTDIDGNTERKNICIEVLKVVYESAGVIFGQEPIPMSSIILDIGGGTVLCNPMNKVKMAHPTPIEFTTSGVKTLIARMEESAELKALLRSDPNMAQYFDRIWTNEGRISILKNKCIAKEGKAKVNCKEVMQPLIQQWLNEIQSLMYQSPSLGPYLNDPYRVRLLTGGGAEILGVKEWAKTLGFKKVEQPQIDISKS